MNRNSNKAVGAMHPILFFVFVYGISLFLAFFVCNTVYNNIHPKATDIAAGGNVPAKVSYLLAEGKPATALR